MFQVFQSPGTIPPIVVDFDNDVHIFLKFLLPMMMALSRWPYKVYCETSQSKVFASKSPKTSLEPISKSRVHFTNT